MNLDSLGRVELLSRIEEELGVYLDESRVGSDTTVTQLKEMIEHGSSDAAAPTFPQWGMSWWCRMMRGALQRSLVFPLLWWPFRLRVVGQENLDDLQGPVLFTANHNVFLDNALIIKAMPSKVRRRLAIAAAAEVMHNNLWTVINPLLGNGFPFSREGNVRASLDKGWSVLIYPEGDLTIGGPIQPFKSGSGLIVMEGKVPVVPLQVHIHSLGSHRLVPLRRRGSVEIRFGKPITFSPERPPTRMLRRPLKRR